MHIFRDSFVNTIHEHVVVSWKRRRLLRHNLGEYGIVIRYPNE